MRRLVPYAITALLALCAGAGASVGGELVTGEEVRDRSLRARDFSGAARRAFRRSRGPRGAQGPQGPVGFPGPPGPYGIPSSSYGSASSSRNGPFPTTTASLVAAGPVSASGTEFLEIGTRGTTTSEADAQLVLPMGFGHVLHMRARVAQPAGSGLRQFRLRFNGNPTTTSCCGESSEYVCAIQPGERTCTTSVVIAAEVRGGDRVAVEVLNAAVNATEASVVFEIRA